MLAKSQRATLVKSKPAGVHTPRHFIAGRRKSPFLKLLYSRTVHGYSLSLHRSSFKTKTI
nr:MAG TPA: hypothetical protein [Caudoviricetes sp.]